MGDVIFGKRLMELRKENGYKTRKSFAEEIDIPETTLRNYETGFREPGHDFIKLVAQKFNISADYLLGLTDNKKVLLVQEPLEQRELHILKMYRRLSAYSQKMTSDFLLYEMTQDDTILRQQETILELEDHINY